MAEGDFCGVKKCWWVLGGVVMRFLGDLGENFGRFWIFGSNRTNTFLFGWRRYAVFLNFWETERG